MNDMVELVIKIPEDVYTRLFDNGIQDNEIATDDICEMARALRMGKPLLKGHRRLIDKDHMIARLEAASKFYGGENADAFDERFSHGLKEAAIKVAEEPTIIETDKGE
jgi:hypothetical protein